MPQLIIRSKWYALVSALLIMSLPLTLQAQRRNFCGTAIGNDGYAPINRELINPEKGTSVTLKVQLHIAYSNVNTPPFTAAQVTAALAVANQIFSGTNLQFVQCSAVDMINDPVLCDQLSNDEVGHIRATKYDRLHCINIYFVHELDFGDEAGFSTLPGTLQANAQSAYAHPYIAIGAHSNIASSLNFGNILAHELGHFFSLYHPNGPNLPEYTDELVNGGPYTTTGDFVGDTPADVDNDNYCQVNGSTCIYPSGTPVCGNSTPQGNFCDVNGNICNPLPNNLMHSYVHDCNTSLTAGQIARINAGYQTYYLNKLNGEFDLITRDDPYDAGFEPNQSVNWNYLYGAGTAGIDINGWESEDIWNCRSSNTCTTHENPGYVSPNKNSLRIIVTNNGCAAYAPNTSTAQLHAYWTLGSTGESWPNS